MNIMEETEILFTDDGSSQPTISQARTTETPKETEDKCTQTREVNIKFTLGGPDNNCTNTLEYSTRDLPNIKYYRDRDILDPRNEDMARIVLYEFECLPENYRHTAYVAIFNELKKIQDQLSCDSSAGDRAGDSAGDNATNTNKDPKQLLQQKVMRNLERMYGEDE